MTELQLIAKRQKYETSHILHLLLSVLTFGAWVPVWLIVALSNANERMKVDQKLKPKHNRNLFCKCQGCVRDRERLGGYQPCSGSVDKSPPPNE